jgi:hypothetical protein
MARSLGTLTLDLVARVGGLTSGMTQAERQMDKSARAIAARKRQIERDVSSLGKAITAGFAGITIATTIKKVIDETAKFQDQQAQLSAVLKSTGESAGFSAQELNRMADAMSGKSVFSSGEINEAQTRLLSYTGVVGEQFPRAMQNVVDMAQRMGMDVKQSAETVGRALDIPSQGLTALSKQGFRFTEEQKKMVEQLERTGKTSEAQGIILKAMESSYSGAAEAARGTLGGALKSLQNSLADLVTGKDGSLDGATGAVNNLADVMRSPHVVQAFGGIVSAVAKIIEALSLGISKFFEFGQGLGLVLGKLVNEAADPIDKATGKIDALKDSIKDLQAIIASPRGSDADKATAKGLLADTLRQIKDLDGMRQALTQSALVGPSPTTQKVLPKPGAISGKGTAAGKTDDTLKRLLDQQLSELKRAMEDQRDLMAQRNAMLDFFNGQGLLSIKDYYTQQRTIADESVSAQVKSLNQQIDALRGYASNPATKAADRISAQTKINDLLSEQAKLQQQAAFDGTLSGLKQAQAQRELEDAIRDVNIQLMEIGGQAGAAAAARFDQQNAAVRKMLEANGASGAVAGLDQLKASAVAQAEISRLQAQMAAITSDLQIQEERLNITRQVGASSELESLVKLGEVRQAAVAQLRTQLALYEAMKQGVGTPEQLQQIERMKLSIEQLEAQMNPLEDRFSTLFEDSFSDAFADFIVGTKTASQAFSQFANSVISEMARMAAQSMAKNLFGAVSGSASSAGGGWIGALAGLFGGARADGGPVMPNTLYRVNERGPELFESGGNQYLMTGAKGGRVIPNGGGGPTIIVNVSGTNAPDVRRAAGQGAREALAALNSAQRYA